MPNDKLEKINKMIELLANDTVTESKLDEVVAFMANVVKDAKANLDNVSQETKTTLNNVINYIDKEHTKLLDSVSSETKNIDNKVSKKLEQSIEEMKATVEAILLQKPEDGKDADEDLIIEKVIQKLNKDKKKLTKEDIDGLEDALENVKEVTLKEAKGILALLPKNPPIYGGGSGATFIKSMRDVDLRGLANGYVLKWNVNEKKWIPSAESGGGSGVVETVVAGTGISVDSTDPVNPIVTNTNPIPYTLPTASASVLGGVKVGTRLSIDGNGVLSADVQSGGGDFLANGTVPMTGDLNLDGNDINNVNSLQFDITPTALTPAEGLLQWNATDGTLNLGMSGGDITQQLGQELFIKVWNDTGSTITNGSAVYFSGRQGNRPKIVLARGDSSTTCMVMGLATQDISTGGEGFITTFGYIRQIKTDYATWAEGQPLWLSTTTAGALTNVEPDAPNHSDIVGYVGVVGGLGIGSIFVSINRHKELQTLADINGTVLSDSGQFPVWNDTAGYFDFTENINNYKQAQFYAGTMTVNTGTLNTGTVADLQVVGGTDVNIQEANGADPLRVTFDFTGVTRMTAFTFFGYYAGGSGHQLDVEIYNQDTTNWDNIGIIGSETTKKWYSFPIFGTSSYINAGAVSVRLRHIQSGNVTHALILDYLDVDFGSAGGTTNVSASSVTFIPSGNLSSTNVASALAELDSEKVIANAAITGATKTKITYDAKGLVTTGADATTADIADSLNKRYVTDAQITAFHGVNDTNTTSNTYADGKVAQTITNGVTTSAPSQDAVFDALAGKAPLISPSFTTPTLGAATATSINGATITSGTLNGSVTGSNTGDQTSIVGISGTMAQFDTAVSDGNIVYQSQALGTPASGTLTNCTFPTLNQNTTGTAANVTGTVAIANGGTGATTLAAASIPTYTSTNTFTNKAITRRVVTTTDDATAVVDVAVTDIYELTSMANATAFSFTGTPTDGQQVMFRFKDNGTTRALTWTGFTAIGVTLPTTTTVSKWHLVLAQYSTAATTWFAIAASVQA